MGWQDRDYNRQMNYGSPFGNPVLNFLFGSLPLGTWFGIRVRLHSSLLLYAIFQMIFAKAQYGYGYERTITNLVVLFTIILLHEFGHCFGARIMRGSANDILLWPLGGLAFTDPPHRPWPTFVTVAAGPLVNVIICVVVAIPLILMGHFDVEWMNPFIGFGGTMYVNAETYDLIRATHIVGWLFWFFTISASLFFFNLLPIFPLDGGQMLHAILWPKFGYRRAMNFSCITGMVGAVIGALVGIRFSNPMLVFLAIMGFMTCYQRRMILKMTADEDQEKYDLSAAWDNPDRITPRKKKLKKRWFKSAQKRASKDQAEQAKIDAILAKVKEKGLHSLSWWEKRTLRKATERQRQQDMAERL